MQVKKDDIQKNIVESATDEFLKKGYENASLRNIAKKANTTLGNIYHYYKNKQELLEVIVEPVLRNIEVTLKNHIENSKKIPLSKAEVLKYIYQLEKDFDASELACFFDKKVLILLSLKTTDLYDRKQKVIELIQKHFEEHFNLKDAHYSEVVLEVLVESLRHVLIEHEDMKMAKKEFVALFKLFSTGIIGQMK